MGDGRRALRQAAFTARQCMPPERARFRLRSQESGKKKA
jgi:hypothetical protein